MSKLRERVGQVAREARKNRGFASGYAMNLLDAAFGSPDRAEAIVEALEGRLNEQGHLRMSHDHTGCEALSALLRDLAEALGVATGGTDGNTD